MSILNCFSIWLEAFWEYDPIISLHFNRLCYCFCHSGKLLAKLPLAMCLNKLIGDEYLKMFCSISLGVFFVNTIPVYPYISIIKIG